MAKFQYQEHPAFQAYLADQGNQLFQNLPSNALLIYQEGKYIGHVQKEAELLSHEGMQNRDKERLAGVMIIPLGIEHRLNQ